ncbi:SIR2 family protein [Inquilinus sp.]|uniref:SIR2 family NAD-dependent protein deacylase n=1 Tax=Inquilinus sp. TaxID=1932117 RepID=UPI0031D4F4B8
MIEWPEGLVNDLARRRAVVVIGSGVSRHSVGENDTRPPTWRMFLIKAKEDCPNKASLDLIDEAIQSGDYLHACEWLKKRYDEGWVGYLRRTFSTPKFSPADIHAEILNLDGRIVFSLNFDDIYERYVNSIHRGSYIIKNYHDSDVSEYLRGNGRYIIKIHGSLNSPENLIFTQRDYSAARIKHSSFYQAFDASLLTHTFLFIGSGHSDPDINLLLENQNFGFPTQVPHYFLTSAGFGEDRKASLRENRNLKVLEYDPVDDLHSGLISELKALNEKVEAERFSISKSTSW